MALRYVNTVASVELILLLEEGEEVTPEKFEQALDHAIKGNKWYHAALPRIVHERPADDLETTLNLIDWR